jgi:membrane protease YdiL (CAAX protease family)
MSSLAVRRVAVPSAVAAASASLALRSPGSLSLTVLSLVGLLGVAGGVPRRPHSPIGFARLDPLAALAVGFAPFVLVRLLGPPVPTVVLPLTVVATTAAAVAEEAFFRRFVYEWLAVHGAVVAVVGAAVLFAVIHIPIYGPGVVFIDFGAGLVFGYQRWATGSWGIPAMTHAGANLIMLPW